MKYLSLLAVLSVACDPDSIDDSTDTTVDDVPTVCDDFATAPQGTICTIAGLPGLAKLSEDGIPAVESGLYLPIDMTMGPDGLLYLIDWNNHRLRRVEADGTIVTLAGTGTLGDGPEGPARAASFNHPTNIKFHPSDPNLLYISAWHNSRIEVLDLAAAEISFECGNGDRKYSGDGGPAADAELDLPSSIEFEEDGSLFVCDSANQIVRHIDLAGNINTIAGTAPPGLLPSGQTDRRYGWDGDGGLAVGAKFNFGWGQRGYPSGRIERDGRTLYIADTYNFVVRKMDLDSGMLSHVAGLGLLPGYSGDGGPAASAQLAFPADLAADGLGNLYIADTFNHCIRMIDAEGIISTVAGVCLEPGDAHVGPVGDGGPASEAHLLNPYGIEVADGVLYIADTENHVIRAVRLE